MICVAFDAALADLASSNCANQSADDGACSDPAAIVASAAPEIAKPASALSSKAASKPVTSSVNIVADGSASKRAEQAANDGSAGLTVLALLDAGVRLPVLNLTVVIVLVPMVGVAITLSRRGSHKT